MAYDLTEPLVIGISSRALFNLEDENRVFETQGLKAYANYQHAHETEILTPGPAFPLVKAFLNLNRLQPGQRRYSPSNIAFCRSSCSTSNAPSPAEGLSER